MLTKDLRDCREFRASDKTILREILHPSNDKIGIPYSIAHATVLPGKRSLPHRLRTTEVYYILSGAGEIHIDDKKENVKKGSATLITPHSTQWIRNTGRAKLEFLCIVSPAWRKEDEETL